MAYATLTGPFFVRKVSTAEMVRFNFNCRFPVPEENRWLYLLHRIIAFPPVMIHLNRLERLVPETILEIFATSNGILMKGPLSETADDGMMMASIHFWSKNDDFTHAAIFLGRHEKSPSDDFNMLRKLVQKYATSLMKLFDPEGEATFFNSYIKPTADTEQQLPDSSPLELLDNPTDTVWKTGSNGKIPFHMNSGPEQKHKIIKPPRFYSATVASICLMAAIRQRNINEGKKIKNFRKTLKQIGPSKNTMRKLPELVGNWYNPDYRWYVDLWLREYTGHTPDEVSQILSDLRAQLTIEDWTLVISTASEKPVKRVSQNGTQPVKPYS
jgi:hypothetical protein